MASYIQLGSLTPGITPLPSPTGAAGPISNDLQLTLQDGFNWGDLLEVGI